MTSHPIVSGHSAVRLALRSPASYSSDLQGDRDVRTYKQLPLEVDPPEHEHFRSILAPLFAMARVEQLNADFRTIARELVHELVPRERIDVVPELALEMVVRCLGVVLGRPQDVDEWRSWGPDVWISTPQGRDGAHLQRYLEAVFDEVETSPADDAFSHISRQPGLSRTQMYGMANIILAGGRDTVVKLMTGFMWHLGRVPQDYDLLATDRSTMTRAVEELVRYLSPLPMMERIDTERQAKQDDPAYAWVSYASANHDPEVFGDPEVINLQRHPNPHLGFGAGPHACIGNLIAKAETRALLGVLFDESLRWEILDESGVRYDTYGGSTIPGRFHSLPIQWLPSSAGKNAL